MPVQQTNANYRNGVVLLDDAGDVINSTNPLSVALNASVALSGDFEIGGVYLQDSSGNKVAVNANSLKVDGSSFTQPVSFSGLPLPAGAATSAAQGTAQTSLTAIAASTASADSRLAGSLAVTGAFYQATQPVSGTFWQVTQPISGSISFTAPQHVIVDSSVSLAVTGPLTDAQMRATAVPISISGTLPAFASVPSFNINNAIPVGSNNIGSVTVANASLAVTGTFWQATQPISAASLPLPSGAATSAGQSSIVSTLGSPFQVGSSIGNSSFGISGTLPAFTATPTFDLGTLNGAATAALQGTINTTLGSPFQAGGSIGNTSFATTNAGTFAVQLTGATNNINNIAGTVSLPTGASTAALQTTGNASLVNLDVALSTRLKPADTLAAVTTVGSITNPVAVTGAFYQSTQPVSAAVLPLPTNATTETGGNLEAHTALMRVLIQEQRLTRQLIAANAGGFIPTPEYPTFH